ncbi:RNA polymerase-binding protein DksA [Parasphingorhabdus sp.]|uniref:RNA polymerase-binding protein DksA n=1 Tax=Parasphingorhabdus sp. TaxID=2709688 RepID=UPI0039C8CBC3
MATSAKNSTASESGSNGEIILDDDYRPSPDEEFMNERQLAYFKRALEKWKRDIIEESKETLAHLQDGPIQDADLNDRASSESNWGLELRTRDRQRKLTSKIDAALRRIEEGEYGYCQVTGEPISLERLEARPIATMSVEAQEAHERNEKISRDQ